MTLLSHVEWTDFVDYFAGDLDEAREEWLETHLLACDICTAEASRVVSITESIRGLLPPFATAETLEAFRRRGLRIAENPMVPGADKEAVIGADLDVMIHRLQGVDPRAASATFSMRVNETGAVLFESSEVPIVEDGSVLLLCSRHYAGMPPNVVATVTTRDASGVETRLEYLIRHVWVE